MSRLWASGLLTVVAACAVLLVAPGRADAQLTSCGSTALSPCFVTITGIPNALTSTNQVGVTRLRDGEVSLLGQPVSVAVAQQPVDVAVVEQAQGDVRLVEYSGDGADWSAASVIAQGVTAAGVLALLVAQVVRR